MHTRAHTPHALAGGKNGNIKVISHNHNEPGHGADICDTAGANCIRECMRCTKRTGLSIIAAYRTAKALKRDFLLGVDSSVSIRVGACIDVVVKVTMRIA